MRVDLRQRMEFLQQTAVTKKRRPEIVIWSLATKQAILLELTVPWEDRIDDAHGLKSLKYQNLVKNSQQNEWMLCSCAAEVGCRGQQYEPRDFRRREKKIDDSV